MTNTGAMHFNRKVIILRMLAGMMQRTVACADTNIHDQWSVALEDLLEVQRFSIELDAVFWPVVF